MSSDDLLNATLALGRLDQAVANLDVGGRLTRRLWQADSLRREALTTMTLDGQMVAGEDLAVALLQRRGLRADVARAVDVVTTGERLLGYVDLHEQPREVDFRLSARKLRLLNANEDSIYGDDDDEAVRDEIEALADEESPLATAPGSIDELMAQIRADTAAGLDAVAGKATEIAPAAPALPEPLSLDWLALVWRHLVATPDDDIMSRLGEVQMRVNGALQRPGLEGAAHALHALHAADLWPEREAPRYEQLEALDPDAAARLSAGMAEIMLSGPGWRFARFLMPWIVQRACGLRQPGPWLAEAISSYGRYAYNAVAETSAEAWSRRMYRVIADGFDAERRRIGTIKLKLETWERAMATGKARLAGKTADTLGLFLERPVMDSATLARRRGLTQRTAQRLLDDMRRAGVVRETTGRYAMRLYLAVA